MRAIHSLLVLSALSLVACSDDKKPAGGADNETPVAEDAPTDHGDKTDLGTLSVARNEFGVFRLGDCPATIRFPH